MKKKNRNIMISAAAILLSIILIIPESAFAASESSVNQPISVASVASEESTTGLNLTAIPAWSGSPTYPINGDIPDFSKKEISKKSFENYSNLDNLGRCGVAFACLSKDTMPTAKRGDIGMVKPAGWHTIKYPDLIQDRYLYNRCHLIAFELGAENANEKNLTTGTRYMNVSGMLPYENEVTEYIKETGNHVMYRVTPEFVDDELVCRGVLIEAYSVEDKGAGIEFAEFCYNVQPGIVIDYETGDSHRAATKNSVTDGDVASTTDSQDKAVQKSIARHEKKTLQQTYILNTKSKVFHKPSCTSISKMSDKNKKKSTESRNALIKEGYSPCGICNP